MPFLNIITCLYLSCEFGEWIGFLIGVEQVDARWGGLDIRLLKSVLGCFSYYLIFGIMIIIIWLFRKWNDRFVLIDCLGIDKLGWYFLLILNSSLVVLIWCDSWMMMEV